MAAKAMFIFLTFQWLMRGEEDRYVPAYHRATGG